jgi:hypothetical protein
MSEMYQEVSANGIKVMLFASITYPTGIEIASFNPGDDPFSADNVSIAETEMGVNGNMIVYRTPYAYNLTMNITPMTEVDQIMENIANADRIAFGKASAKNVLMLSVIYPQGRVLTYIDGALTSVPGGFTAGGNGRMGGRSYTMAFRNVVS